ncbi:2-amino-4-hydroxy-6-hydroxymethyldihydropteridine diphosphokinase [Legionella impletisoli]|uniref:2-amino-4-hydroxy-6-hydroxymethyldihydropteridine pyrophosphokinase n=1 Tax=Legionella impletisoli TaxID=343510 RepID=A0A917N7S4_9GAMM|nr:2-amino-4-hydroxy-6-hydroxymethyldihydropteridine diphosphokinase [Legionella impletisoli]GGI75845.1 2-amino-4-hydroxy-6-hydroxymethyldihydropteridine diphosphokinase [Legionella impletisoli]
MNTCFLALGSNLKHPERQLRQAVKALRGLPKTVVTQQSRLYVTEPLGSAFQPGYCNQVIKLFTNLPPLELLSYCQAIELKQKRVRKRRWGPRTLDIDILLYGDQTLNTANLTLPHPELYHRDFVLIPLLEIIGQESNNSRPTLRSN